MTHFSLFVKGPVTKYTGEWRDVGTFDAPHVDAARQIAWLHMERFGENECRVYIGTQCVAHMKYSD